MSGLSRPSFTHPTPFSPKGGCVAKNESNTQDAEKLSSPGFHLKIGLFYFNMVYQTFWNYLFLPSWGSYYVFFIFKLLLVWIFLLLGGCSLMFYRFFKNDVFAFLCDGIWKGEWCSALLTTFGFMASLRVVGCVLSYFLFWSKKVKMTTKIHVLNFWSLSMFLKGFVLIFQQWWTL